MLAPNNEIGGCPAGVVELKRPVLPAGAGVVDPNKFLGADDEAGVPGVCVDAGGLLNRPPLGFAGALGLANKPPPVVPGDAVAWPNNDFVSPPVVVEGENKDGCDVEAVALGAPNKLPAGFWLFEAPAAPEAG